MTASLDKTWQFLERLQRAIATATSSRAATTVGVSNAATTIKQPALVSSHRPGNPREFVGDRDRHDARGPPR
jgi:hypothetical protein